MNMVRRSTIREIRETLSGQLDRLKDALHEEREYYDNIPEGLQGSERAEAAEEAIDTLENAYIAIDAAINYFDEITGG